MTETEADEMYDCGKISAGARKAVSNINGHSDLTVKNYYVKKRRRQDAEVGQEMFDVLSMENPLSSDNWFREGDDIYDNQSLHSKDKSTNRNTSNNVHHNHIQLPSPNKLELQSPLHRNWQPDIIWGQDHPECNSSKTRITWSDEENQYIRNWWMTNGLQSSTNIASKLLAHIKRDPAAHRIFHPNHTLDSARMRHGLRANGFNK